MKMTNPYINITSISLARPIKNEIPLALKVNNKEPDDEFSWSDKFTKYLFTSQIVLFVTFLVAAVIMV